MPFFLLFFVISYKFFVSLWHFLFSLRLSIRLKTLCCLSLLPIHFIGFPLITKEILLVLQIFCGFKEYFIRPETFCSFYVSAVNSKDFLLLFKIFYVDRFCDYRKLSVYLRTFFLYLEICVGLYSFSVFIRIFDCFYLLLMIRTFCNLVTSTHVMHV